MQQERAATLKRRLLVNRFFRSALFPLIVIVLLVYLASQTLIPRRASEKKVTTSELIGQVQEAQLVFDIGVANRGALDAITERLIVNRDGMVRLRRGVDRVPVVDQLRFVRH